MVIRYGLSPVVAQFSPNTWRMVYAAWFSGFYLRDVSGAG